MTKYTSDRQSVRTNRIENPGPIFTSISFITGTFLPALALFAAAVLSANAVNAQTVVENRAMDFATAATSGESTGSIILATDGSTTATGSAVDMGGQSRSSKFTITGTKNTNVIITLPSGPQQVSNGGSTATMHSFVSIPAAGTPQSLGGNGRLVFEVGATLDLSPGQAGGNYTGTFNVFVDYI